MKQGESLKETTQKATKTRGFQKGQKLTETTPNKAVTSETQKKTDAFETAVLNSIGKTFASGKDLNTSQINTLKKYNGLSSAISGSGMTEYNLFAQNNPQNKARFERVKKIVAKQEKGEKLTQDEKNTLETAKLINKYKKSDIKDKSVMTSDTIENAYKMQDIAAKNLYNDAAYGSDKVKIGNKEFAVKEGDTKTEALRKVQNAKKKVDLYVNAGLEQYVEGVSTALDVLVGVDPEDIAKYPDGAYSTANAMLKQYYTESGKKLSSVIQDTVTNIANNAPGMLVGAATAGVPVLGRVLGTATFGVSVFGNAYKEAARLGITDQKKLLAYSLATTGSECGLEFLIGGLPGIGGVASGKVVEGLSKKVSSAVGKAAIKMTGNALGEFIEEGTQSLLSPILQKYLLGADVETVADDPIGALSDAAYEGFIGALTAVFTGGISSFAEAKYESNMQACGRFYKVAFAVSKTDVRSIAEFFNETAEKRSDVKKLSQLVARGDTSNLAVGNMMNAVARATRESNKALFTRIGENVRNSEGGVEAVISAYEKAITENKSIFPGRVVSLYNEVKENTDNASDELVGELALKVEIYAPRAAIIGNIIGKAFDTEAKSVTDTEVSNGESRTDTKVADSESVFTERSAQKPEYDMLADGLNYGTGMARLSENQLKVASTGRALGHKVIFENTQKTLGVKSDGYIENDGTIHIDYNCKNPVEFVFKHELTHFGESTDEYKGFAQEVKNSKVYEQWISKEVDGEESATVKSAIYLERVMNNYKANGVELTPVQAEAELIANFTGDVLFRADGSGLEAIMSDMSDSRRSKFVNFFKNFIAYLKAKLTRNKTVSAEVLKLERLFNEALSAAEQKNTRPDIDRTDVVFANGGISYSFNNDNISDNDSKQVINIIKNKISKISDKTVFNEKSVDIRSYNKKSDYVLEIFNKQGNVAVNKVIGKIELVKSGAKSTMLHGYGKNKIAAIPAIKTIIENGDIISHTENYTDYYDRYIIAAKGIIDGKLAIVGVVINSYNNNGSNKFYLHEVEIIEAELSSMTGSQNSEDTVNNSASDNRIPQSDTVVKNNISESTENYSASVKNNLKEILSENGKDVEDFIPFELSFESNGDITDKSSEGDHYKDSLNSEAKKVLKRHFDKALTAAEQKYNATEGDVKYSIDKSFDEQIDDVINGTHNPRYDLYVDETPEYLVNLNFSEKPMLMRNGKVSEIIEKHSDMSIEILKQIPNAIKEPLLVLKSKTHPKNSVVIITDISTAKGDLIVPVWANQSGNYIDLDLGDVTLESNFVASAYGRNTSGLINYAVKNDGVLYQNPNTKKVEQLLARNGLQLPTPLKLSTSDITISQSDTVVKNNISENAKKYSENISETDIDRTDVVFANGGVSYSLRPSAEADVEKALKSEKYRDDVYLTESSPSIIVSQKGTRNLPMLMKASHIRENVFTEQEAKSLGLKVDEHTHYHGLGKTLFLKIIDGLNDVKLAYRGTKNASNPSRRENYFLLISQYKDTNGNTVNVPVYIDEKGQYNRVFIDTNKIATVFGRDNFLSYIRKEIQNGNLVRIKNKSTQASERTALIAGGYSKNAFTDNNISQSDTVVKNNISENTKKYSEYNTEGGVKYRIAYTTDNKPVAVIEEDILDGVPKSNWVKTMKKTISEKFSNGIPIGGRLVKVNKITRNEYTNSKYSKSLKSNNGTIYADKFKSANNLDDIVLASTNYINEDLKHSRKDNFKEFARGDVLIRVGGNDYSAKVIVGFTNGRQMVLYDVIDFNQTSFEIKERTPHTAMQKQEAIRSVMSSTDSISNLAENVNKNISASVKANLKEILSENGKAVEDFIPFELSFESKGDITDKSSKRARYKDSLNSEVEVIKTDSSVMTAPQLSVDTVNKSASDITISQSDTVVKNNISESTENYSKDIKERTSRAVAEDDVKFGVEYTNNKIVPNMSDSERANIIKDSTIEIIEFKDENAELSGKQVLKLKSTYKSEAQKILKYLAEKFGVFKDYSNDNIELEFNYSRASLNESVHKQNERKADFYDFAKMLYIFDDVIKNAQPIESHTDKYSETQRENKNLKQVFVLLSAFKDGDCIIPVEFNIKEFSDETKNQLYISVTMQKMEADLMGTPSEQSSYRIPKSTSEYSLAELIQNVKPSDEDFLKYIPDELLSSEQIAGKNNAVNREKTRIDNMKYEYAVKNSPEKQKEHSTHRTLHADVNNRNNSVANAKLSKGIISNSDENVNNIFANGKPNLEEILSENGKAVEDFIPFELSFESKGDITDKSSKRARYKDSLNAEAEKLLKRPFNEALTAAEQNNNTAAEDDAKYSITDGKITMNMSDDERAKLLNNTVIKLAEYDGKSDDLNGKNVLLLKSSYNSQAGKILKSLGEKFGVFKTYNNQNVSLDFDYSRASLNESIHKQGDISTDFYDFAKMLYVFDEVVKNAVPIEVHTDKYKGTSRENTNLKSDYVLLSAFRDDNYVVPVEFHLKEMHTDSGQENKLYVSVTLGKIKMEDKVKVAVSDENHQTKDTRLSPTISIPDLISKVNPEYGNFYKYLPNSMLNEQQNNSKNTAVDDENYRLKVMRGEDVTDMLEEKAKEKGYSKDDSWKIDHKAPNSQDGYSNSMDNIDKSYGSDGSIYSQQAVYYYGEGREYDSKAISIIKSAKNNPEKMIKIYRAVPNEIKDTRVRNGDWVAIVKEYAIEHGGRVLDDDFRIIENTVPAKQLFSNGDSINEWGYDNGNANEVYKKSENNVKIIDVTYADNGKIIPLSERFNDKNPDIRYSIPTGQAELLEKYDNGDKRSRYKDSLNAEAEKLLKSPFNEALTAAEQKNTLPDIDRTDVTFAGNSTGISLSQELTEYPYNMQTVIKDYLSSADKSLLDFVKRVESDSSFARHKISNVSENQALDIKRLLNIDVSGFTNNINSNAVKHIEKRHGKNGVADTSMSNALDIARLGYVLKNYDTVDIAKDGLDNVNSTEFKNSENRPVPMLIFSKKINGTYYIAQAIPESQYKKLWVVSAYISKKEAGTQALNIKNNSQVGTSLASSASDVSISQSDTVVKNNISENTKKYSEYNTESGVKYSIAYTTDNKPVAVIEEDILDGVPKSKWVKIVKNTISGNFSDGIPISGRIIKINSITKNEYVNSKNAQYLRATDGTVYADKFKSANNLDDIVLASTNYINEDLKHSRKDNFKEFARGEVLIRVGNNDYSAKVIVGFTGGNQMVLYDVVDFTPTEFSIKNERTHQGYAEAGSPRKDVSSTDSISNSAENVNKNISASVKANLKEILSENGKAVEDFIPFELPFESSNDIINNKNVERRHLKYSLSENDNNLLSETENGEMTATESSDKSGGKLYVGSENNMNYGDENYDGADTELLERGKISAVDPGGDGIRQPGGNSEKLASYLGVSGRGQGNSATRYRAGESGWMVQKNTVSEKQPRLETGVLRAISRIAPSGEDTVGRKISPDIAKKFKNTVFKDEKGNLLSVYHWTNETFERFEIGDIGFHFGTLSAAYDRYTQAVDEYGNATKGNYKEAYLNITSPIELKDLGSFSVGDIIVQLLYDKVITRQEYEELSSMGERWNTEYNSPASQALRELLEQRGYDGIIYKNESEDVGNYSVIALYPEQIITVAENGVLKPNCGVTENNIKYGDENYDGADTELLERGKISAVDQGGDGIRQPGGNSEMLRSRLERLYDEQGGLHKIILAGESGWLVQGGYEAEIRNGFENGIYRKLSRTEPCKTDSAGRILSEELRKALSNTALKNTDGTVISVFHWTQSEFDSFKYGDIGFHGGTLTSAMERQLSEIDLSKPQIFKEMYFNITNPLYFESDGGLWDAQSVAARAKDVGALTESEYEYLRALEGFYCGDYNAEASAELRKILISKGYDGILYVNGHEDVGSLSVIAFEPKQIITVAENGVLKPNCGVTENNIKYGDENYDGADTELLERGKISAVDPGGDGIRQQSGNSEMLRSRLERLYDRQGTLYQSILAGESGWLVQGGYEAEIRNGFANGIYRKLSRTEPCKTDSAGRILSEELRKKLSNTALKNTDGTVISVFHWTQSEFDSFKYGDIGFHGGTLTSAMERQLSEIDPSKPQIFKEMYFNITNPLYFESDGGFWDAQSVSARARDTGVITENEYGYLRTLDGFDFGGYNDEASAELRKILISKGYDGILYVNGHEDVGSLSVIAFEPKQIITVAENGVLKPNCGVTENNINYRGANAEAKDKIDTKANEIISELDRYAIEEAEEFKIKSVLKALPKATKNQIGVNNSKLSVIAENSSRSHLNATEQSYLKELCNALDIALEFENTSDILTDVGKLPNGKILDGFTSSDGILHLGFTSSNPAKLVMKHMLYVFCKGEFGYDLFENAIKGSAEYRQWLSGETAMHSNDISELENVYAKQRGFEADTESADIRRKAISDFVAEALFKESTADFDRLLSGLSAENKAALIKYISDFLSDVSEKACELDGLSLETEGLKCTLASLSTPFSDVKVTIRDRTNQHYKFCFVLSKDEEANREVRKLQQQGVERKEIWEKFGIIDDHRGNLVREIEDRDVKIKLENLPPDLLEYYELKNKSRKTEEEKNRFKKLKNKFRGNVTICKLGDIIDHNELFEIYPELKQANLFIANDWSSDLQGITYKDLNTIGINTNLFEDCLNAGNKIERAVAEVFLRDAFFHELQHLIQYIEKRESGTSITFWKLCAEAGYAPYGIKKGQYYTPEEAYTYSGGEIEARLVGKRATIPHNEMPDYQYDEAVSSQEFMNIVYGHTDSENK